MRHTIVKSGLAFAAALLLASCSSNSPTAPPTPTPASYNISLSTSSGSAEVGTTILFSARVTSGTANVADGTSVTFKLTGCVSGGATDPAFENGLCEMTRTTSSGVATATVISSKTSGYFEVVARVAGSAAAATVRFYQPTNPRNLALYSINPNRGRPEGGQQVTILGRGFATPVTVDFIVAGGTRHAQVLSVSADGAQIVAVTPPTGRDATVEQIANVLVTAAAGSTNPVTDTLMSAFTFEKQYSEPRIYSLSPNRGAYAGGEQVTIYGANFFAPVKVQFGAETAQVTSVSADNSQITVLTPTHAGTHINQEQVTGVTVFTRYETAQVQQVSLTGAYTYVPDSGTPIVYSVTPSKGSPQGSETIVIKGANFFKPVKVTFNLGAPIGTSLAAEVRTDQSDDKTLTIVTPQASPTPAPVTTDVVVGITIQNQVGSANSQTATFNNAFIYVGEKRPPVIYYLDPNRGSARGGDDVTVYGRFFIQPVRVRFAIGGEAQVTGVAADGTSLTLKTPNAMIPPLGVDTTTDVTVTSQADTGRDQAVTLVNGFLFIADQPTPEIYALSPNSGPTTGGTRVTITGKGFQYPVQVFFTDATVGQKQAEVISQNFNTIVCVSPSITPAAPGTPETVNVSVLNVTSGKKSGTLPFRYGEAMFISAITASMGPDTGGTQITIFGQGFSAPVAVEVAGVPAAVRSVAGTEVVVITGAVVQRKCTDIVGPVKVTNVDSGVSATGGSFDYTPMSKPFISSIDVCTNGGTVPAPRPAGCTVTITGQNFEPNMRISFTNPNVALSTTFVNATTLTFPLPNFDALGIIYRQVPCGTAGGTMYVPTAIDVKLTNTATTCFDTLTGGLVVYPLDGTCRVPPAAPVLTLSPTAATLSKAAGGSQTITYSVTVTPAQAGTLNLTWSGTIPAAAFVPPIPATVAVPASGLATFTVTVNVGSASVLQGQTATITGVFGTAAPATSTITVGP